MSDSLEFDRTLLGKESVPQALTVDRKAILKYCRLAGITSPIHTDDEAARTAGYRGMVAPISMYASMVRGERPDIKLSFGRTQLFAGATIEALVPVCAGDVVTGVTWLKDVYAKTGRSGTMVFIVWETSFSNQDGEKVAVVRQSYVRRSDPGGQHAG